MTDAETVSGTRGKRGPEDAGGQREVVKGKVGTAVGADAS